MAFQRIRLLIRRSTSRFPGKCGWVLPVDGVQVRRVGAVRQPDAETGGPLMQLPQEVDHPLPGAALDNVIQGIDPFPEFHTLQLGVEILPAVPRLFYGHNPVLPA